jgi:hypothetical protein
MTISSDIRREVQHRADFSCQFCGISETDVGGELTVDHFQPLSKGGDDGIDNLIYCCPRCNQYKLDYWPGSPDEPQLWNPRAEPAAAHFIELEDGTLHPLTGVGAFSIQRLRLNRPPLVAHRLRRNQANETQRLLTRYHSLVETVDQLLDQQTHLLEEQRQLLEDQRLLLQLLLGSSQS